MKKYLLSLSLLLITVFVTPKNITAAEALNETPVVHAVLFYSPSCGHCYMVITEVLPPLIEKYGDQLQLIGINTTTTEGQNLYRGWVQAWNIPENRRGVPTLVVGDTYLFGSGEIPEQFPGIIEEGLLHGGIGWPNIPGFDEVLDQAVATPDNQQEDITPTADVTQTIQVEKSPVPTKTPNEISSSIILVHDQEITFAERFRQDFAGNSIAVIVLVGMVISVIWILVRILTSTSIEKNDWSWTIPIFSILGIFVAGYLTFVEVTETEAVCGPIGNCNDVQQSPYAIILGFLPVGVLGLIGYLVIIAAWLLKRYGPESWRGTLSLGMWGMALFGVIFSIYLTFLEPFVIGATCMWCISSAIIITLQLWAATGPVQRVWADSEDEMDDDFNDENPKNESGNGEG